MRRERQGESERPGGGCGEGEGERGRNNERVWEFLGVSGSRNESLDPCQLLLWVDGRVDWRKEENTGVEGRLEGKEKEGWRCGWERGMRRI